MPCCQACAIPLQLLQVSTLRYLRTANALCSFDYLFPFFGSGSSSSLSHLGFFFELPSSVSAFVRFLGTFLDNGASLSESLSTFVGFFAGFFFTSFLALSFFLSFFLSFLSRLDADGLELEDFDLWLDVFLFATLS